MSSKTDKKKTTVDSLFIIFKFIYLFKKKYRSKKMSFDLVEFDSKIKNSKNINDYFIITAEAPGKETVLKTSM